MAKNHAIEINLLDNKNINFKNEVENLEFKNKDDIDIFTFDSYLYLAKIICKHWKKQDTTNCLKFFVWSHLYYFLFIANNANITTYKIYYNLNILKFNFWISYKLSIKTEISSITTDL